MGYHKRSQVVLGYKLLGYGKDFGRCFRVKGGRMLVKQKKFGFLERGHKKGERLALSSGEKADLYGHPVLKPEAKPRKGVSVDFLLRRFYSPAETALFSPSQGKGKIFLYFHSGGCSHHGILEHSADVFRSFKFRLTGNIYSVYFYFSGVYGIYSGDHIEGRAFSGSVSADDGHEIAFVKMEINAVQSFFLVYGTFIEGFFHIFYVKHFCHLLPCTPFCPPASAIP